MSEDRGKQGKRGKALSAEERALWEEVAKDVKPLSRQRASPLPFAGRNDSARKGTPERLGGGEISMPGAADGNPPAKPSPSAPTSAPYFPPISRKGNPSGAAPVDRKTARKLAKGRLAIDARIDLHGLYQTDAHDALLHFLSESRRRDRRIVLVITGKGRGGAGILRQLVPRWFAEAAFRQLVGGWREADISHGGEGALYVRIRRDRAQEPSGSYR